ncbi:MAG: hypothetical protein MUC34_19815 [Anaerolineae bacterium]|jgi:hypothetical protein|nr:hypothetical protein [Anaerolineae bacterium]
MSYCEVRSEVFLRQDIVSILESIDAANRELAARLPSPEVVCYRAGFADAIRAVATAFHATLDSPSAMDEPEPVALPPRPTIRIIGHVPPKSIDRRTSG